MPEVSGVLSGRQGAPRKELITTRPRNGSLLSAPEGVVVPNKYSRARSEGQDFSAKYNRTGYRLKTGAAFF